MEPARLFRLAAIASVAAFLAAWAALPLPHDLRVALIDVGWFTTALVAGIAALWARGRDRDGRLRRPLGLLAASSMCWAAGQAVWTYQEVVREVAAPVFHVADAGYWLSLPFLAAAILTWPRERLRWRLDDALDVVLITGFALLFGLEFVLAPLLEAGLDGWSTIYSYLYPPAEVAMFAAGISVFLLEGWHERRRLQLIGLGVLALALGDAGYTYLGADYATGGVLDPLWALGFGAVGYAAAAPDSWSSRPGWIGVRGRLLAPAAALIVLAVAGFALGWVRGGQAATAEVLGLVALTVLLAVRQAYAQIRLAEQVQEQRRLEQQLQHAQKLEAVGRLAGGVAHDFNNLLTAIDGYGELAAAALAPGHPVRSDIDEIRRATQRAAELTRQLLAFSRRQVLAPQVVDLNAIVRDADGLLRRLVGPAVRLETSLDRRRAWVVADAGQLEQVLTNLVVNARDAMPDGGSVTISTAVDDARVRLSVADTGVGIPQEVQARMFEPFFTTKEPGRGTGLGLAVVHGVLAQSRGEIGVRSAPGRGTTFDVALPLAEAPEETSGEEAAEELHGGSETVLLVEDEDAVRELARRMLELAGFAVLTARSAEEALELAAAGAPFHALVTDVVMPGANGDELAARLLDERPGIGVVLMSGYSRDSEAIGALQAEGAVFVEKPFTANGLVAGVRAVLDGVPV